jgi:hypothetical protein
VIRSPDLAPPPGRRGRRGLLRAAVLPCFAFAAVALAAAGRRRDRRSPTSVASIGLATPTVVAGLFTSLLGWRAARA